MPIAETVRSFREVLDGKHDDLPESAFFLKGSIDDVVEAAKKELTMARTPFTVEVLTPEGEVFNDEVEMVSTRTSVGSIGILANHQPLLAMLDPTELRLYRSESEVLRFAQGEGFLQMSGTHALVLVDEVLPIDELDAETWSATACARPRALERAEEGSEERAPGRARQAPLRGVLQAGRRKLTIRRSERPPPEWRPRRRLPCCGWTSARWPSG